LVDDPDLIGEICNRLGERIVRHVELSCQYETVGIVMGNDDFGFKTQPMLSPDDMRKYIIPWHKRLVEVAHRHGKYAVIHSCGQNASLMDDIIDVCGYDGKHSYEDVIQPVEEAYEQYHARIGIMGGMDVDFLTRSTPEAVYRRAKAMLERVGSRGSYGLGTGNSIPTYLPQENALAMMRAATEGR